MKFLCYLFRSDFFKIQSLTCLVFWVLHMFWKLVLCQIQGWWRSFPIVGILFFPIDGVLCFTEAFQLHVVPFINCWSNWLCYWCSIQEVVNEFKAIFFSISFIVPGFILRSLIYLNLSFVIYLHSSHDNIQLDHSLLFPLYNFGLFVKNQLSIGMWIYVSVFI